MSVYVGPEFFTDFLKSHKWPYSYASHLFSDTLEELHQFAESIGLKRGWFQDSYSLPHYDITQNKRNQAIKAGAIPVDRNTEVHHIRLWRRKREENERRKAQ